MSAIFITATGTDIGKTFVAAGLIRHWRAAGRQVDALKPVVTGFDPAAAAASDPGVLLAALGRPRHVRRDRAHRAVALRRAAVARHGGAAREPRHRFRRARSISRRGAIAARQGTLLIEGIGGVMVPLDDKHTVLDWMAALNIPVVLVTGSYLGSLSHTLTALDAMRSRAIAVTAVVVNETAGSTVSMADTEATLGRLCRANPDRAAAARRLGRRARLAD